MMMARTPLLTSYLGMALVGLGWANSSTAGEFADDRDGVVIILRHGVTAKAFPAQWSEAQKADARADRKKDFDAVQAFDIQVVPLGNESTSNPDALPTECLGSIDAPVLGVPRDNFPKGMDQKAYGLSHSPCYSLATTQFVQNLVADSLVNYFGDPPAAAAEGMRDSIIQVLREENQALLDRLAALEVLVAELQNETRGKDE